MYEFQFARLIDASLENTYSRPIPRTNSHSIEEGLKAKTKDPLWFLTRQWQLGEFAAELGGQPVSAQISYQTVDIEKIHPGNGDAPFENIADTSLPMETAVEGSFAGGQTAWDSEHLEYKFTAASKSEAVKLEADEYYSGSLEWFDFDLKSEDHGGDLQTLEMTPAKMKFGGMPNARWWTFEDESIDLGDISRPELNMLSMVLIEYALLYSDDWYLMPIRQNAGSIRFVQSLSVKDNFGIIREIPAIKDESPDGSFWSMYTLSSDKPYFNANSNTFLLPNTAATTMDGEPIERVTFARDEGANLVWAVEHKYNLGGKVIDRDDEEAQKESGDTSEAPTSLPRYRLKSQLRGNWIPYSPRYINEGNGNLGFYLRRGRTIEDTTVKQYKGTFLSESVVVHDEEIPREAIELNRRYKLVTVGEEDWFLKEGPNGYELKRVIVKKVHSWVGREKKPTSKQPLSRLRYDYVEDAGKA